MFQPDDQGRGSTQLSQAPGDELTECAATATYIATVSSDLDMIVLDGLFTALESTLTDLGATRVWIDRDRPAFAVMAELPATPASV
ncbi:MAG TPA: hypothetical protein VFT70_10940 [Nocardioides sp.]|nr:hypothetical protein [Nocardioides sp.]